MILSGNVVIVATRLLLSPSELCQLADSNTEFPADGCRTVAAMNSLVLEVFSSRLACLGAEVLSGAPMCSAHRAS
jgi:hypothetical protein